MANYLPEADMKAMTEKLIDIRRDIHKHPESAWTEYHTTAVIIDELRAIGIEPLYGRDIHVENRMGLPTPEVDAACLNRAIAEVGHEELLRSIAGGFTGAVAIIEGAKPGPTVAMRFDIDCCDQPESTDADHFPHAQGFGSVHENAAHVCGHDVHAAIGLGTARLLWNNRDQMAGKAICLFQPGEEGARGAWSMVEKGLLDGVTHFLCGHMAFKEYGVGDVCASVVGMAASYKVDFIFHGLSAHAGSAPDVGKNAIAAGATATLGLLGIPRHHGGISRVNVGILKGGTGRNVIPDRAELVTEIRGGNNEVTDFLYAKAVDVCEGAAKMYGCTLEQKLQGQAVISENSPELVERVIRVAKDLPGVKNVIPEISMRGAGEDATVMMNHVLKNGGQANYMYLGAGATGPHHNGRFDVSEDAIELYARMFTALVLDICK